MKSMFMIMPHLPLSKSLTQYLFDVLSTVSEAEVCGFNSLPELIPELTIQLP